MCADICPILLNGAPVQFTKMNSQSDKIQLPAAAAQALKDRWVLFFEARLLGPTGLEEWKTHVQAVGEELMHAPLSVLIDAQSLCDALDISLSAEPFQKAARPLIKAALSAARAELQGQYNQSKKIGDFFPEAAKKQIDQILQRSDLMPEQLIRHIAMHDASEEIMRDVLYDTLKEFLEKVNPFFAEWGLPALLKKVSPFGLGGFSKGLESMKGDFDKRLEPEIRKFLQGFSKKGLGMIVEKMLAKSGEPKAIALRKSVFAWLLSQELAQMAKAVDARDSELFNSIGLDIAGHILSLSEVKARRRALIADFLRENGQKNILELMSELGISRDPAAERLFWQEAAEASFPLLKAALLSPSAKRWMAHTIDAFIETHIETI